MLFDFRVNSAITQPKLTLSCNFHFKVQAPLKLVQLFERGLDKYYKKKWEDALTLFQKSEEMEEKFTSRNTNPSLIFIARCKIFMEDPPDKNWDGVWTMTSK